MLEAANAALAKGDLSLMYDFIIVGVMADGYGGRFENVENQMLGVPGKTEADIEAITSGSRIVDGEAERRIGAGRHLRLPRFRAGPAQPWPPFPIDNGH